MKILKNIIINYKNRAGSPALYYYSKYSTTSIINCLGVILSITWLIAKRENISSIVVDLFKAPIEFRMLHFIVVGLKLCSDATTVYKSFILFNK